MTNRERVFLLFQCALWISFAEREDYCSCPNHILCMYPDPLPNLRCKDYVRGGLGELQKEYIVNATNSFRSRIAMGDELLVNTVPQPSAADMMEVTWDDFLGVTSQKWADRCSTAPSDRMCRLTDDGKRFGESSGFAWNLRETSSNGGNIREIMKDWEDEVNIIPQTPVDKISERIKIYFWSAFIDYAQLASGKTSAVGCGLSHTKEMTYLVCHFKPEIEANAPLYKRGKPASDCPKGSFASKYRGLCAWDKLPAGPKTSRSTISIPSMITATVLALSAVIANLRM